MRKKRSRILIFLGGGLGFFLWFNLIVSNLDRRAIQTRKENNVFANYQHPLIPVTKNKTNFTPVLSAKAFILLDTETNTILISKKEKERIYPASTTKLITALTALNIYPLDEIIEIDTEYENGKVMELKVGEKLSIRDLVKALLVHSANDAAFVLAKQHKNGVDGFVKEMNGILKKNGLEDSNFVNYDGIHDENHYSTVYDLAQVARLAIKNKTVTETVKIKELKITSRNGTEHLLLNTNELLETVPEVEGLKTGWTPEAGGCFAGLLNIEGHRLISVVAQSEDRFADTLQLLEWAKKNIEWEEY
ncbi:D-alanyl-D-alanine carboxypeptidase [Patescibacteria group bacterium]|nr:D-alanyl-D-alanine carboxypeptidase [Patescibacteria group bacterium]MCG2702419.1 D-alanyl-D-alanine carboxypeptidase [Candidatus Parcubacteria bacterium]MBU4210341.1 D-alanyl-D-alanine carboxypeptidase [Patescibacteria group bacterium]MBU4264531.1 D-alanyl-D-alanine carboxypeptidase [Patescibacteria group bacterium]MBU4390462.1 D-alanyl-D-alanine carboxypeptidase [Patescibacteria group bacterium]